MTISFYFFDRSFQSAVMKSSLKESTQDETDVLSCEMDSDSDISLLDHHQLEKETNSRDMTNTYVENDGVNQQTDAYSNYSELNLFY